MCTGGLWPAHSGMAAMAGGSEHTPEEARGRSQAAVGEQAWQTAAGQRGHQWGNEYSDPTVQSIYSTPTEPVVTSLFSSSSVYNKLKTAQPDVQITIILTPRIVFFNSALFIFSPHNFLIISKITHLPLTWLSCSLNCPLFPKWGRVKQKTADSSILGSTSTRVVSPEA